MLHRANNRSLIGPTLDQQPEEWEVRPGGMLVQKRELGTQASVDPIPMIRVKVQFGHVYHEVRISPHASFGELKKLLVESCGLHHEDQKLIYRNRERGSRTYLDTAGVKDGSRIVLVEDVLSRERRCLEMLKKARIEKAQKSINATTSQINKLAEKAKL
ncbi:hypothetical protein CDL15_Pgr017875 [Punica granatum]|uniref:Ubiquitin-like domain-containing protein n=1 Tax=Punica granatum TaxID=22663 RepID=A0A218WIY0_PUNGR|nr:hypothetical protein CDL15_Pgr017875 [Punica granatum]